MSQSNRAWVGSVLAASSAALVASNFAAGCGTVAERTKESLRTVAKPTCLSTDVVTQRNGNNRRSEYVDCTLNAASFTPSTFKRLFSLPVHGLPYAQPLIVHGVATPLRGTVDVLYVVTTDNDIYAFDASGSQRKPIWHVKTGTAVDFRDHAQSGWAGGNDNTTIGLVPQEGILSTPVVATINGTEELFVLTELLDSAGQYHFELQAYNAATGAFIATTHAITAGNFDPEWQVQRPALTYVSATGTVYVGFGSHADQGPWQGFLMGFNASNLAAAPSVLCMACTGNGGASIWQAGSGLVVDSANNVYAMTGNGPTDAPNQAPDDSLLQFSTANGSLALSRTFVSPNDVQGGLNGVDLDFASGGPVLIESQGVSRIAAGGKEGKIYMLDPASLSGPPDQTCQGLNVAGNVACTAQPTNPMGDDESYSQILGAPAYWTASDKLFVWGEKDYPRRFATDPVNKKFTLDQTTTNADLVAVKSGGALSISEDGSGSNPIVWANARNDVLSGQDSRFYGIGPGRLIALDQSFNVLWASTDSTSTQLPGYAKFNPPMIANGNVYQATFTSDDRLYIPVPAGNYCPNDGICPNCTTFPTHPFTDPSGGTSCGNLTGSVEVYGEASPTSARTHRDFDGDGNDDLLWRNTGTGAVAIWLMNGTSVGHEINPVPGATASTDWAIQFRGDFNGDGIADILWRATRSGSGYAAGDIAIWFMRSSAPGQTEVASTQIVANRCLDWSIVGVGDFDNDGVSDILFEDTNRQSTCGASLGFAMWLMNRDGTIKTDIGTPFNGQLVSTSDAVQSIGDFDGDGVDDIPIWNGTTGTFSIWYVNGSNPGAVPDERTVRSGVCGGWTPQDVGDFDHDGKADVLWRFQSTNGCAPTGEMAVWEMNGRGAIGAEMPEVRLGSGSTPVPTNWVLASTGDVDGDGHSDLIWEDTNTGNIDDWLVTSRQDMCQSCSSAQIWTGVPLQQWTMTKD